MSEDLPGKEELVKRLAKAEERVRGLEGEVEDLEARLRTAGAPKRTALTYLLWVFWFFLVMALGAYLYRLLTKPAHEFMPPRLIVPPIPSEGGVTKPAARGTGASKPAAKPGLNSTDASKAASREVSPAHKKPRLPGFPDASPPPAGK